jgi:hypothetical protein
MCFCAPGGAWDTASVVLHTRVFSNSFFLCGKFAATDAPIPNPTVFNVQIDIRGGAF